MTQHRLQTLSFLTVTAILVAPASALPAYNSIDRLDLSIACSDRMVQVMEHEVEIAHIELVANSEALARLARIDLLPQRDRLRNEGRRLAERHVAEARLAISSLPELQRLRNTRESRQQALVLTHRGRIERQQGFAQCLVDQRPTSALGQMAQHVAHAFTAPIPQVRAFAGGIAQAVSGVARGFARLLG